MRGQTGTYSYTATTGGTTISTNAYNPSGTYSYTAGDGAVLASGDALENLSIKSLGNTTYSGDAIRQIMNYAAAVPGPAARHVYVRFRLLNLDTRGIVSGDTYWSTKPYFAKTAGETLSSTYGAFIDKCDGTGATPANPNNSANVHFPFTGNPVDLSPYTSQCSITQDQTRPVQRTMSVTMVDTSDSNTVQIQGDIIGQAKIDYLYNWIQPIFGILAPDGTYIEQSLGIFKISTPQQTYGGYVAARQLECSDLSYLIQRNVATAPPNQANIAGGSGNVSGVGVANSYSQPTTILNAGATYQDINQSNIPLLGANNGDLVAGVNVANGNPCCTSGENCGFVYLVDAIRAMLTNSPDHPCLPGCGFPPSWIHPQFPRAPLSIPGSVSGPYASFNWNKNGGSVDGSGPIMDALVPPASQGGGGLVIQEGMSYLDQINNLLQVAGFDPLYVTDTNEVATVQNAGATTAGLTPLYPQIRSKPWPPNLDYTQLHASYIYDTTRDSIVDHGVQESFNLDNMCNVVNLVMEDSNRDTIYAWVENNNVSSPISVGNYGSRLVKVVRASNVPRDILGSDKSYALFLALYHLNLGGSMIDTVTLSTEVVPLHESGDIIALNIYQRFFGAGDPRNQAAIVGGTFQSPLDGSTLVKITDRFKEIGWEIQVETTAPNSVSPPGAIAPTTGLSPTTSKSTMSMRHTLQRVSTITPDSTFNATAGSIPWTGDT